MTDQPQVLEPRYDATSSASGSPVRNGRAPVTDDTAVRVRRVVAAVLDVEPARLNRSAKLIDDLCVDSLAATELALVLEDEFDIAIPDDEREPVVTYGDLEDLVVRKVHGGVGS